MQVHSIWNAPAGLLGLAGRQGQLVLAGGVNQHYTANSDQLVGTRAVTFAA
jgi:hypothetical protein